MAARARAIDVLLLRIFACWEVENAKRKYVIGILKFRKYMQGNGLRFFIIGRV